MEIPPPPYLSDLRVFDSQHIRLPDNWLAKITSLDIFADAHLDDDDGESYEENEFDLRASTRLTKLSILSHPAYGQKVYTSTSLRNLCIWWDDSMDAPLEADVDSEFLYEAIGDQTRPESMWIFEKHILQGLESLSLINMDEVVIDVGVVAWLTQLKALELSCRSLANVEELAKMTNLQKLEVTRVSEEPGSEFATLVDTVHGTLEHSRHSKYLFNSVLESFERFQFCGFSENSL
jgi:hypothetical protein